MWKHTQEVGPNREGFAPALVAPSIRQAPPVPKPPLLPPHEGAGLLDAQSVPDGFLHEGHQRLASGPVEVNTPSRLPSKPSPRFF